MWITIISQGKGRKDGIESCWSECIEFQIVKGVLMRSIVQQNIHSQQ